MDAAGGYGSNALARRLRWLYPPMPTLNVIPSAVLKRIQDALFKPDALVVNVGAGGAMGCGARLWRAIDARARVVHLDIGPGPGIGLIADAMTLPFGDAMIDSLVLQAVLEHVREPRAVIAEAFRVLKPGGHIYIEMPFLQGFHADPDDFQRYTMEGLRWRLKAFEIVEAGVSVGPFSTLVWLLRDGMSSWTTQPILYAGLRFFAGWVFSPLRYLDFLVRNNRVATRLANEFYVLARKPFFVMPGLMPGIHGIGGDSQYAVDGRHKTGHDAR